MTARWLVVVGTAVLLVVAPLAFRARPVTDPGLPPAELAARILASGDVAWSGFVETAGSLQVPDSDSFASLVQLLGEDNQLRVWWRSADDWRVDRIRSTGETDLFRLGDTTVRWVFESETATIAPVSKVRLPDESDLVPPSLARWLLDGARADELQSLPARRIAGIEAAGLRLRPAEPRTTVGRVDVWADPATGLPVQVELYGLADRLPVLTATLRDLTLGAPDPGTTAFEPADDVTLSYEESVDVAAAANAFAPYDLPRSLGGLPARGGVDPGAVGVYGRGPTTLFALPLRGQVAGPLRSRLLDSAAAEDTVLGTLLPVGLVTVLVSPRGPEGSFLLAGTVSPATLEQAAGELGSF